MRASESASLSKDSGSEVDCARSAPHEHLEPAYADCTMSDQQRDPKPEDEATKEQGQADDRRRKDQSEKLDRDRADEAGRRAREGT